MLNRGLDFAMEQLARGVSQFRKGFWNDNQEITLEELKDEEDVEYNFNEDDDDEEDEEEVEYEDGVDIDYIEGVCPCSERDSNNIVVWKYP